MGKTRDLFKKIRDTKGTFHAKMGKIKNRNGMALTEAEGIKKRWEEYREKLYKKDLHDPDNHDGVITDLEPDILECEVKWALGSITRNKVAAAAAAAAAKSLQSCLTLRPHRRQPTRLPRLWDSPGKNTGVGCHCLLWCILATSS